MSTVTYFHQKGIHATRGAVPLAGNSHLYKVEKLLWPPEVERFIAEELIVGSSLHVCCGKSTIGDIRIDLYEENVDVKADAARLPFGSKSFDTVFSDPPYNGKFQWNHDLLSELVRIAKRRVIFQHWFSPVDKLGNYKKDHSFRLVALFNWMPKTYFGRMQIISVFDRIEK